MPYAETSTGQKMTMPNKAMNTNATKVMKTGPVWHHTDGEMNYNEQDQRFNKENHNSDKKTDTYA